ncbi:gypsy retrotransposon integrase-like protein 1 [Plakobranchus ocellatus]|uniref:Gypsy retrotransposon integrase-like protein 1 n=1 Tax=Plakobranchus ocellatus TaxID=259542 RepID=A0AAV3ZWP1_9GAST|nr:gypsy retrotransposon integrase-like protein 1 [Plakobranchus ocellatus]
MTTPVLTVFIAQALLPVPVWTSKAPPTPPVTSLHIGPIVRKDESTPSLFETCPWKSLASAIKSLSSGFGRIQQGRCGRSGVVSGSPAEDGAEQAEETRGNKTTTSDQVHVAQTGNKEIMHIRTRDFRAGTTALITTSADKIKEISEATHNVDQGRGMPSRGNYHSQRYEYASSASILFNKSDKTSQHQLNIVSGKINGTVLRDTGCTCKSTANNVNPNNSGDNKQAEKNENTSYKTAVNEFKREDLEKEQQSDPTLETVRAKAKNNNETYYTYNGIIFRRTNNKSDFDQIVLPKSMRQEVLQACHDSPIAGHLGINATKKRVCSRFTWPSIIRDVNKYVKSCDVCQRNCNKLPNLPIQIADIIDKPFDKVAIDIVGPMMMSDSKNRFILTLVDAATRWPEAVPLKSISTTDVANALFNIFTRLGVPKEILSDNGQQLVSKAMEEVMTMMGIQR